MNAIARLLLTAVYVTYIPKRIITQTFDRFIPLKTLRFLRADVQSRKYCITKQDSALFVLF